MFASMKDITARAADALDLAIEFSTLGEYGLEYPERAAGTPAPVIHAHTLACEAGRLHNASRAGHRMRPAGTLQPRRGTDCSSEATDFASALRPPRIKLSFTES
jgi:hypothetical protein